MPFVLTTGSTVLCGHGATVTPTSSAKLTVAGEAVLLENTAPTWSFDTNCGQTASGQTKCAAITTVSGGASSKLSVGGIPVLTDSLSAVTTGAPANTDLSATAGQNKMEVTS